MNNKVHLQAYPLTPPPPTPFLFVVAWTADVCVERSETAHTQNLHSERVHVGL